MEAGIVRFMSGRRIAAVIALLVAGCGADENLEQAYVEAEQRHARLTACDDENFDHWRYMADLAAVAAQELGRWNAVADFETYYEGSKLFLGLSETGRARCGECLNTEALLQLQRNETRGIHRHSPRRYRFKLLSYFWRTYARMLERDWQSPEAAIEDHQLELMRTTEDVCGDRYHYRVTNASTGDVVNDLDSFADALIFAGNPENLYLGFQVNYELGEVSFDPSGSVTAGGTSATGSCRAGSPIFFSVPNISGGCCIAPNGFRGALVRTSFNSHLFKCE